MGERLSAIEKLFKVFSVLGAGPGNPGRQSGGTAHYIVIMVRRRGRVSSARGGTRHPLVGLTTQERRDIK